MKNLMKMWGRGKCPRIPFLHEKELEEALPTWSHEVEGKKRKRPAHNVFAFGTLRRGISVRCRGKRKKETLPAGGL